MASTGLAQNTGDINGRVLDATGALLPGVSVTLDSQSLINEMEYPSREEREAIALRRSRPAPTRYGSSWTDSRAFFGRTSSLRRVER